MEPKLCFHKNLLECRLCRTTVKNPKALPCLHSFCTECLKTYIPTNFMATRMTFPCPECLRSIKPKDTSRPVSEWADLFPDNFFILNMLNNSKVKSRLNIASEEKNILKKKKSLQLAGLGLLNRSASLPKRTSNIPTLRTKKSISSEHITKSVTFSKTSTKPVSGSTAQRQKKHFEFESKENADISCTKIFRSNLKPPSEVGVLQTNQKSNSLNKAESKNNTSRNDGGGRDDISSDGSGIKLKKPVKRREIHADLMAGFPATLPGIEMAGELSNVIFTPDGYILVADPKNRNIKKFSRDGRLLDLLKLDSEPGDMALVSNSQVAVTLFHRYEIDFITFNKSMKITGRLSVSKQYHRLSSGLGWTLVGLSMSPGTPATLDVFHYTGEIVHSLVVHVKGRRAYLTTSLYGDMLISSCKEKVLSGYDVEGALKFKHLSTDQAAIVDPKGLCTDMDGYIYLADGKVNKIHRLAPDGTYDCEFLSAFDGVESPAVLCMDRTGRELVAAQSNGKIKIFTLRHCLDIY